jgi:AcrR family transcriptional regulator
MSETVSRRELVREERRRQILDAALAVFTQKGFYATNVSDVAARAGVSQGTIYWYFESKEELFTAALLSSFTEWGQQVEAALHEQLSATAKLGALAASMEAFVTQAEGLIMLFLGYWASSPNREETALIWLELLTEYKDILVGVLEQGIESGEFKPVDAEALVWAMMAVYDGLAAYVMFMPELDLERVSQAFNRTLLDGLLAG